MSATYDGVNGTDWYVGAMPYVVASGAAVAVVVDPNNPYWFDRVGGSFVPRYGVLDVSFAEDSTSVPPTVTFTKNSKGQTEKFVFASLSDRTDPGGFLNHTDGQGSVTTVVSRIGRAIAELQRDRVNGATTTTDSLLYSYTLGKIDSVVHRRRVNGGTWSELNRAAYTYHSDTAFGKAGDLKLASRQQPKAGGGWETTATTYYRYYTAGSPIGFPHGLKVHVGPEAFRQLFNAGIDVETAADAVILPYADHYFEYDPYTHSVTKEIAAVCESCVGGGTTSDTFEFVANPRAPLPGYNVWSKKTVQTLPDSSKIIVFTNFAGVPILKVNVDPGGTNKWCTFYRFDENGRLIWEAQPSAVNGYDEGQDDLLQLNATTGLYAYLNNDAGLINVTQRYGNAPPAGGVEGYVASTAVRKGQAGSDVLVQHFTYDSHTDAAGNVVHPIATTTAYPSDTDTTQTITTAYAYTWFSGKNQTQQRTTTLPAVPTTQNGSGVSATIVETFDALGNLTQRVDERGLVSSFEFNAPTPSSMTRQTLNVQTGITAADANVVTDFEFDQDGRLVCTLGPTHTVDLSGTTTSVRTVTWFLNVKSVRPPSGLWAADEDRMAMGYATGISSAYSFTLVNPVSLTRKRKDGRVIDQITASRTSGSGALSRTDTFAQADWHGRVTTQYDSQNRTIGRRTYHSIPATGDGLVNSHFDETTFGYDALERQNRVVSAGGTAAGGTITRTVWTTPERVASVWVGTNDAGATDANPAASGGTNNMVKVSENQYDNASIGDGNVTLVTQYVSDTDTRVTAFGYDFRDRRVFTDGELDLYEQSVHDNLGRLVRTDRRDTAATGLLIGRSDTHYDDRGRAFEQLTYAVDLTTGTASDPLTSRTWFDPAGNVLQQVAAGDGDAFSKFQYDGLGRTVASYRGYSTVALSLTQAATVADDVIVEQSGTYFDVVGNPLSQSSFKRLPDTTGNGALSQSAAPQGRASFVLSYADAIGRTQAMANLGAITSFMLPATIPVRTDDVLVNSMTYDAAGRRFETTDPMGRVNRTAYDAAGRTKQTIESYDAASTDADTNRVTNYAYTADGQISSLTAVNPATGDQVTTYVYGSSLTESGVARSDLLRHTAYPDSTGPSDRVSVTYNRLGQQTTVTDQRGTVRTFSYDKLGRPTDDAVTTLGTGTDGAVRRISRAFDARGLVASVTSHDAATAGTTLNEVKLTYDSRNQLTKEAQEHAGAATTATLAVQYGYTGSTNRYRFSTQTYPSGRVISYGFGTASAIDDKLNRLTSISAGTSTLATYTYLGQSGIVKTDYPVPAMALDLWGGTTGVFAGLDRFGRTIDHRWQATGLSSIDLDRYRYGYDRNANPLYRQHYIATDSDELYTYDRFDRLTSMKRGALNSAHDALTATPVVEAAWTLDRLGNWLAYQTKVAGTTDLAQTRTANKVNEITAVTNTTGPTWANIAYDAAGNMTTAPKGEDETTLLKYAYDGWNRLVKVKDASDALIATYAYDGTGRRTGKAFPTGSAFTSEDTYYNAGYQAVETRRPGTVYEQTVFDAKYIDAVLVRYRDADSNIKGLDETLFFTHDRMFNVTGVWDASRTAVERYRYTPYGERTVLDATFLGKTGNASTVDQRRGHQGLILNSESGVYENRARHRQSSLGGFVTRDYPVYRDGMNVYEYVGSNTLRYLDSSGKIRRAVEDHPYAPDPVQPPNGVPTSESSPYGPSGKTTSPAGPTSNPTSSPDGSSDGNPDMWGTEYNPYTHGERYLGWLGEAGIPDYLDALDVQKLADAKATGTGLPGHYLGPQDAFRHCFGSCTLSQRRGCQMTERIGTAHENSNPSPIGKVDNEMDLHNNARGRQIAFAGLNCSDACMAALRNGTLRTIRPTYKTDSKGKVVLDAGGNPIIIGGAMGNSDQPWP